MSLPFQLSAFPQDLEIFTDFEDVPGSNPQAIDGFEDFTADPVDFTIGNSPNSVLFEDGRIPQTAFIFQRVNFGRSPIKSWYIRNGETGTITFETPALEVQFYAVSPFIPGNGSIEVFDTNDNLLTVVTELPVFIDPFLNPNAPFLTFNANDLGAPGGIGKIKMIDDVEIAVNFLTGFPNESAVGIDDFGFTPIPNFVPPVVTVPEITSQPTSQEVASGTSANLSVVASGDDLTYQWFEGNSGDTASPVSGATGSTLTTGVLTANTNFWIQITNVGGSADSETAVITIAAPPVPLVLEGTGDIAGENIQHPNGNIFDQILLTGETIQLQARPNQITRVCFMDETEDIVQVEFSGTGSFTVTLDPATFLAPAIPPRYNQAVEYVTGKPSVTIDGADANTFFSIFTVGSINAVNQALFPEGQVYDAQADRDPCGSDQLHGHGWDAVIKHCLQREHGQGRRRCARSADCGTLNYW